MMKTKRFIFAKQFVGLPKVSDFKLVEEELPALKNGEYLMEAEYLSVDPYMRAYVMKYPTGITMIGSQVGKIIQSKNPKFKVGQRIVGEFGWRTHTIIDPNAPKDTQLDLGRPYVLPDIGDLSPSLALGVLGMPGNTSYFGFLEICKPKAGETLVVSGAAGAVGTHVGQIGKIMGLKVIGICGSDEKCKWITKELGFDHAINYKTQDVGSVLAEVAPNGVDCYFDNVGGELSSTVMNKMNLFGRISVCGCISSYNNLTSLPKCSIVQIPILMNQLKMEGFVVTRWGDRWMEGVEQNLKWVREGKLIYRETVTEGFENMPKAFIDLLCGGNFGKAIVKV